MSEVSQPTVERVLGRLCDGQLVEPGERYVALVSGGRDSVCLLDALVTICGSEAVEVLHVNYGLRGGDADADELHVRGLCEGYGVGAAVLRAGEPPRTGNLQAWARDLRYGEAAKLALASGARIATGHTASDQVETILYRLAASPGRRALLGMAGRDGRLIRPLLGSTREETAEYCRERGLAWREDATNADERFARGRIRHGLLGELRRVHPAAEQNILASVEQLRAEAAALDAVVAGVLDGRNSISIAELTQLDPAIARLILVRLAEDAAGKAVPAAAARLSELAALATKGGSTELHLAGVTALIEYGVLHFTAGAAGPQPSEVALTTPGQAAFGVWRLTASLHTDLHGTDALEHLSPDGSIGVLDADTLELDRLTVRGWHSGDRLRPIGLDGSKTLADLFADRKLPRAERASTPLLTSAGEIVWIPGIATAQRVAVGPQTTRVVMLSATRARAGNTLRPRMDDPLLGEVLVNSEDLQRRVRELGAEISRDYVDRDLLLICVLKGAVLFLSDLMRAIEVPCQVDFMAVASYGSATDSSGVVRILKDLDAPIEGRHVLIVEDIVDSGLTLQYLLRSLGARDPASVEVCALLTKPERRKVDLPTRYVGFEIDNRFAVGYGLDYAERYRNLPFVAALADN